MDPEFNSEARKVLGSARDEAIQLQHDYIGIEHLLLGLAREEESVGATVLTRLSVDLKRLRDEVGASMPRGRTVYTRVEPSTGTMFDVPGIPYSLRGMMVLRLAMAEAVEMGHTEVGSGHLLIGLLSDGRAGRPLAGEVLGRFGVSVEDARRELQRPLHDSE